MSKATELKQQPSITTDAPSIRSTSFSVTRPERPSNTHFGVGPIAIAGLKSDPVEERLYEQERTKWILDYYAPEAIEQRYRLLDPKILEKYVACGTPKSLADIQQFMHRAGFGLVAVHDLMAEIHNYLDLPEDHKLGIVNGGGHAGFTAHCKALLDPTKKVFLDTPNPNTKPQAGHFRQTWAKDIVESYKATTVGDCSQNIVFSSAEGVIPSAEELEKQGVNYVVAVGNETTGCTRLNEQDIKNLQNWKAKDPENRHIIIDGTSWIGSEYFPIKLANIFTPLQKALGGPSMYGVMSLMPEAVTSIENTPGYLAVDTIHRLAENAGEGKRKLGKGLYDAETDSMGPVINTLDVRSLMEGIYALQRGKEKIGDLDTVIERSHQNYEIIEQWLASNNRFKFAVADESRRSRATALLELKDTEIPTDKKAAIVAATKAFLGREGITLADGTHVEGMDAADNMNAYPGTPGDIRFWMGGVRDAADIEKLTKCLDYAYDVAKAAVLRQEHPEFLLARQAAANTNEKPIYQSDKDHLIILQAEWAGGAQKPLGDKGYEEDLTDIRKMVEDKGGVFVAGQVTTEHMKGLQKGQFIYSYQPAITTSEITSKIESLDRLATASGKPSRIGLVVAAKKVEAEVAQYFTNGFDRMGSGVNNLPLAEAAKRGIRVSNMPGFNTQETVNSTWKALDQEFGVGLYTVRQDIAKSTFASDKLAPYQNHESLEGKTVAFIGMTSTSAGLSAKHAKARGMNVVGWGRNFSERDAKAIGAGHAKSIEEAVAQADVVSVNLALNPGTTGIINDSVVNAMKPGTMLVMYSCRGQSGEINAIQKGLESGKIARIIGDFDIFPDRDSDGKPYEALAKEFPGKVILTGHTAADTGPELRQRLTAQGVEQQLAFFGQGHAINHTRADKATNTVSSENQTPPGVGRVTQAEIQAVATDIDFVRAANTIAALVGQQGNHHLSPERTQQLQDALTQLCIAAASVQNRLPYTAPDAGIRR